MFTIYLICFILLNIGPDNIFHVCGLSKPVQAFKFLSIYSTLGILHAIVLVRIGVPIITNLII